MISKKDIVLVVFLMFIGSLHGYFVASLNYNKVVEDMYRVAEENNIKNRKEVDKLMDEEDKESASSYVDKLQLEYDELYR